MSLYFNNKISCGIMPKGYEIINEDLFAAILEGTIPSFTISNDYKSLSQSSCFSGCSLLTEVIFEEPCQITELPSSCFSGCSKLEEITIPSSVR